MTTLQKRPELDRWRGPKEGAGRASGQVRPVAAAPASRRTIVRQRSPWRARLWLPLALPFAALAASPAPRAEFEAARNLYETRHYSAAREQFNRLAGVQPADPEIDFYLGRLALWFDDEPAALAHLERAARQAPNEARIQNALGDACGLAAQRADLFSKPRWAMKCLAAYERAVALEPNNPAFRWSLVGYYLVAPRIAGGGDRKALAEADEIRKLDPLGGHIARATFFLARNKFADAFAEVDGVLREKPDEFLALYQLGRCAAVSGQRLEHGQAALQRCLVLAPPPGDGLPSHAEVHYRLGNVLEKKGDAAGATAEYAVVAREYPDFRPAKVALKN